MHSYSLEYSSMIVQNMDRIFALQIKSSEPLSPLQSNSFNVFLLA
jgi:hypothetical protein